MPLCLCLLLIDQSKPLPIYLFFSCTLRKRSSECPKLFFGGGRVGEMGAQRVDQTGRKYLSFSLVSEKEIF